jgi:hypothetical protein
MIRSVIAAIKIVINRCANRSRTTFDAEENFLFRNNRISFKHLYHSYLSAFFISAGVPNGEFSEILIAKCTTFDAEENFLFRSNVQ